MLCRSLSLCRPFIRGCPLVSRSSGFSCCGAHARGARAPVVPARGLRSCGHGLSCSGARGIFLDQGLNPCLLHWQMDSLLLNLQGKPHSLDTLDHISFSSSSHTVSRCPTHVPDCWHGYPGGRGTPWSHSALHVGQCQIIHTGSSNLMNWRKRKVRYPWTKAGLPRS